MTKPRFEIADIRRYYDRHTASFLKYGQGGSAGVIHRAVWGAGVDSRLAAFHYVDDRIAELIGRLLPESAVPHVVDLGCGVGASLCYLAARLPMRGTGITLSLAQAQIGTQRIREARMSDRVQCMEGDYCAIPTAVEPADLAYAIESFVHGPDPRLFFSACARLIRAGGLLVICDDFRRPSEAPAAELTIDRFRRGWRINTLLSQDELRASARAAGFEHESTLDLTAALEVGRGRDRAIQLLDFAADWLPLRTDRLDYLLGGSALQKCLTRGWIGYDLTVFRRLDQRGTEYSA